MTNAEAKRELRYMFSPVYAEELINALSEPTIPLSVIEKIRTEVLEYIDDLDIAYAICDIFDKAVKEIEK